MEQQRGSATLSNLSSAYFAVFVATLFLMVLFRKDESRPLQSLVRNVVREAEHCGLIDASSSRVWYFGCFGKAFYWLTGCRWHGLLSDAAASKERKNGHYYNTLLNKNLSGETGQVVHGEGIISVTKEEYCTWALSYKTKCRLQTVPDIVCGLFRTILM